MRLFYLWGVRRKNGSGVSKALKWGKRSLSKEGGDRREIGSACTYTRNKKKGISPQPAKREQQKTGPSSMKDLAVKNNCWGRPSSPRKGRVGLAGLQKRRKRGELKKEDQFSTLGAQSLTVPATGPIKGDTARCDILERKRSAHEGEDRNRGTSFRRRGG